MKHMIPLFILLLLLTTATIAATPPSRWWGGGITWFQYPVTPWIAGSYPEYVVVDPDYGPNDQPWNSNDLERLKASGAKVIAYLNIGFAEEWRDYWNSSWSETDHPEWIEWVEYPGWPGEYFVKYWHPSAWEPGAWIDILKGEIDKIVSMGFDGVRLDNIDSYTYWEDPDSIGLGGVLPQVDNASTWMIYLVGNISEYAHSLDPGFIVIANMGAGLELLDNATFINSIDGIEREEVWYSSDQPVDPAETSTVLSYLRSARDNGKIIYVLDYAWTRSNVEDALSKARSEGFYIYVSPSYDLDKLPAYIPSYHGIDTVITSNGPVIAWSYHGPYNDAWRDEFDIYIGILGSSGVTDVSRISPSNTIDERPSIAYDQSTDRILVVYETNESSGNLVWIKGVAMDPATLSIIQNITVAYGSDNQYMASVEDYNGLFYIFYVNETDNNIYYTILDPTTLTITARYRLMDTTGEDLYPVTTTTPSGVAVAWFNTENNELNLALVNESNVSWSISIDSNVSYQRYGLTYVPDKGLIVVYEKNGGGYARQYDLNGALLASASGLPDISWMPSVSYIGSDRVAYTGMNSIEYLLIGSISYIGSTDLGYTPTTGSSIIYYNGDTLALTPSPSGNNTIAILQLSIPQPIPEPPIPIMLSMTIILIMMMLRRNRNR